jgi:hypothetical protein
MDMTDIAARVAHRYLQADTFVRLTPISVPIPVSGDITTAGLERILYDHGIEAHEVEFTRVPEDPPTTLRWRGYGRDRRQLVAGQLVVNISHDRERVSVSAEIALPAIRMTMVDSEAV